MADYYEDMKNWTEEETAMFAARLQEEGIKGPVSVSEAYSRWGRPCTWPEKIREKYAPSSDG